ncbi:MAG TPA: hypothetical protein VFE05_23685 [Longimicrobiaceae bacterium]|jgi:hypothetical protein|nr:hypothetical protein [Longimicrobiaceae bacterium]
MLGTLKAVVMQRAAQKSARAAIGWLGEHQSSFRIAGMASETLPWQIKPVSELVMMLTVLTRHGVRSRTLDSLTAFALAETEAFDWHDLAAFEPSAATPLAGLAEFFALHGRPPPFEMEYFDFLRAIDFFEGMDRFPYREMDTAYCYSRIGIPGQQEKMNLWFGSTAFGRGQSLTRYTLDDLYSLTHAIFYLTDMGRRPLHGNLPAEMLERLHRELVALTAMLMRADNIDLMGELLLCWILSGVAPGTRDRTVFRAGMERVLATVTPDGAVAPRNEVKRRSDAGGAGFGELYHTTLVCAMLFTLAGKRRI